MFYIIMFMPHRLQFMLIVVIEKSNNYNWEF